MEWKVHDTASHWKISPNFVNSDRNDKIWVQLSRSVRQCTTTIGQISLDKVHGALQGTLGEGDVMISRAKTLWCNRWLPHIEFSCSPMVE